ncbi:MAG: hypothetical protein HOM84_05990 [Thiotrichales bacterium]|jgi:hypothetical protein|nr:hypothetical protein [Thiotrichales bacterium]
MANSIPKWTDERTDTLTSLVGDTSPVTQATVTSTALTLETTPRSISSKLRKMGYEVELAAKANTRAYTEAQESELADFVNDNSGRYTYGEIAAMVFDGEFSPKSIQGKLLSMELTEAVKPTVREAAARTYSDSEEATVLEMIGNGDFVEDIADALGKSINSIRGKALSLSRTHGVSMPKQRESHAKVKTDALEALGSVSDMSVEDIADAIGKTVRGVKTMLTHRSISCSNYDGAKKAATAAAKRATA